MADKIASQYWQHLINDTHLKKHPDPDHGESWQSLEDKSQRNRLVQDALMGRWYPVEAGFLLTIPAEIPVRPEQIQAQLTEWGIPHPIIGQPILKTGTPSDDIAVTITDEEYGIIVAERSYQAGKRSV